eukprot:PLAT9213.1.p2 GENE.PLAT9213.1~~PLAT9213.1.p2  ORF type:complete len:158 (+),score=47.03 PLAT9213.1:31-504(+)
MSRHALLSTLLVLAAAGMATAAVDGSPHRDMHCAGCPSAASITPEVVSIAQEAFKRVHEKNGAEIVGDFGELLSVRTQVVAGINYLFNVRTALPGVEGKVAKQDVTFTVFKSLPNRDGEQQLRVVRANLASPEDGRPIGEPLAVDGIEQWLAPPLSA